MGTYNFNGPFSEQMSHYVQLKQHSGSDYNTSSKMLLRFDRYLVEQSFCGRILTRQIFQDYFKKIKHLSVRGFANHYSVLQQFSSWLNQHVVGSYVLEKRLTPCRCFSRPPYIFNDDEIKSILKNSAGLSKKQEAICGLYRTLFGLLYSTGMRIGEALALNRSDFIRPENLVHIKKGKFRKERYLVLSKSANHWLNDFYDQCTLSADGPLFINTRGNRLTYQSVHTLFTKTLLKSGIEKSPNGPRLHDFRHTFAVHCLFAWYKTQKNIQSKLPLLSTYMGHVDITSTQIYLTATEALLKQGCDRFHIFFKTHQKKTGGKI